MTDPRPADQNLYPLGLRLTGRRVLVVGAGPVATRRIRGLVEAGADVLVVAPEADDTVRELAASGVLIWAPRRYDAADLHGAWLVHTVTGDTAVDATVARDAESARIFCVTAGDADRASAWVPAVARTTTEDGASITVSVHAGGDPRRAVAVRDAVRSELDAGTLPLRRFRGRQDPAVGSTDATASAHAGRPTDGTGHGHVALVGGGPGDPGLLTTRGRRLLAEADVVVVDRLAPRAVLADLADDVLVVDVGKTSGHHPVPQDEINALLVEHGLAGRRVVRLKGGDPYVFGRGGEEAEACRSAGVPVEIVPGVTSAVAVPAAAGIPVTHRGLSRGFTVLTGHEDVGKVPAAPDHTVVLLMGVSRLAETAAALVAAGRDAQTPVAVVEDGFGQRQRTTVGTLATIAQIAADAGVLPPAVTVVGDVVTLCPEWAAFGD